MNFTFGIITDKENPLVFLEKTIDSIKALNIPNYEIIIIGGNDNRLLDNITVYAFEEHPTKGWITKKKNLITKHAKYENIVYMHDYFYFDKEWYNNFLLFGDDWEVCMNRLVTIDGKRFRDWHLCLLNINNPFEKKYYLAKAGYSTNTFVPKYLLPYEFKFLSKLMYISGSYWVAKKYVMEEFPQDESFFWNEGEDRVWSWQVNNKYNFYLNHKSIVYLNKAKPIVLEQILPDVALYNEIERLNESKVYHHFDNRQPNYLNKTKTYSKLVDDLGQIETYAKLPAKLPSVRKF